MSILKQQFTTIFSLLFCRIPEQKIHKIRKETDVELLCKAIYDNGEQYMDGTGAISFMDLKVVSKKINFRLFCLSLFPSLPFVNFVDFHIMSVSRKIVKKIPCHFHENFSILSFGAKSG